MHKSVIGTDGLALTGFTAGSGPYLLYMGVEVYPKDHNSLLSPTTRYAKSRSVYLSNLQYLRHHEIDIKFTFKQRRTLRVEGLHRGEGAGDD